MILNYIQIDNKLRPNQNGFRTDHSTTSHIIVLRRIIGGVKNHYRIVIILYIDFRKAFCSIQDVDTKLFVIKAEVLQGDTLVSYIFTIVLEYIMIKVYNSKEDIEL